MFRFQCLECCFGDHEVGHLVAETEVYCVVCLAEQGRLISLPCLDEDEPDQARDSAQLEKSRLRSLAGVQLPMRYDAMCCQCGSTIQHRLDRADAIPCDNGHAMPPTIALAAIQPKDCRSRAGAP